MKEDLFFLGVKALIRRVDGKVLVLRLNHDIRNVRNPEGWDIPGGRIKQGESIEEVLRREVKEEAGIDTSDFELIVMAPTSIRLKALDREIGLIFGIYTAKTGNSGVVLGDEHESFEWIDPMEAADRLEAVFPALLIERLRSL